MKVKKLYKYDVVFSTRTELIPDVMEELIREKYDMYDHFIEVSGGPFLDGNKGQWAQFFSIYEYVEI